MTSKKQTIYAGTFDIFTNGHNEILQRALTLFDEITLLVAVSSAKKTLFDVKQRVEMLEILFKDNPQVKVDKWEGLIAEYARVNKIDSIIRGLRPTGDFEYEFQMASMNKKLYPNVETVLLMAGSDYYCVSSALVKEIWKHGGDISGFVAPQILNYLNEKKL